MTERIPAELIESQLAFNGAAGQAFVDGLPDRADDFLRRWDLRRDGPSAHGVCALVLPVLRSDGAPAALKLQYLDEETAGEPVALRAWDGDGAVRLLEYDEPTGTLLLERLHADRRPSSADASRPAVVVIAGLLARLTAHPAPPGLRRLDDMARGMLERLPAAARRLPDPADRRLLADCGAAVREVADEGGERLLHWDLHYDNVLAADREPWLAIDPKPLAGDPGFELFPALHNRFEAAEVSWRFEAMTAQMGLDRERARAWTLGRVLQNALWDIEAGRALVPAHLEIARRLLGREATG